MKIIDDLKSYVREDKFKLTIIDGKVNIVNYTSISHFDVNEIRINHPDGVIVVLGKSLVITRLMSQELLISGNVEKIELR